MSGLVGKSDTIANILDTNETITKLLEELLTERYPAVFEGHTEDIVVEPLLTNSLAFYVGHGSPRQALHRDDMIFASKHHPNMKINEVDGFSCFIAGTDITRENGGTMVVLGSHKWPHDRAGRPDEVSFLGKISSTAVISLLIGSGLINMIFRNEKGVSVYFSQQHCSWRWLQHNQ
jgi:hypothetical protein